MPKHYHVSMSVRGLLRDNLRHEPFSKLFKQDDGTPIPANQAIDTLFDCIAKGRDFLPVGPPCDHFDYAAGCVGHDHAHDVAPHHEHEPEDSAKKTE